MPFYDYVCQSCGRRIEVMHGVHATGPERCDACGGELRRAISRPAIHFKGSGWAKMDARAASARTTAATPATKGGTAAPDAAASAEGAAGETGPAAPGPVGADATPAPDGAPPAATGTGPTGATAASKHEQAAGPAVTPRGRV